MKYIIKNFEWNTPWGNIDWFHWNASGNHMKTVLIIGYTEN